MRTRIALVVAGLLLTPAVTFATFSVDLQQGNRGPNVVALQQFLVAQSLLASDNATGYFGPLTRTAVKVFQARNNISPVSGYFGPLTRGKANALLTITPTTPPVSNSASNDRKSQIDSLRALINDLDAQIDSIGTPTVTHTSTAIPSQPTPPASTVTPPTTAVNPSTQAATPSQTITTVPATLPSSPTVTYSPSVNWSVPSTNERRELTWGESYTTLALVLKGEYQNNKAFLAEARDRILATLAARDDMRGVFSRRPVWSFTDLSGASCPVADAGTDGMILYPMTRYLLAVQNAGLAQDVQWSFPQIQQKVLESVRAHQPEWNDSLGAYGAPSATSDCYRDSRGRPMSISPELPFNLQHAMGRVHADLSILNGTYEDKNKASKLAAHFKNSVIANADGSWVWSYWMLDPYPNGGTDEDTSHGLITLDFVREAYNAGIAFTWDDLQSITKTLLHIFPNSGVMANQISGRGIGDPASINNNIWEAARYLPFATTNPSLTGIIRGIYQTHHSINYGIGLLSEIYAERTAPQKAYGASCTFDEECATGSCYAGKICGYPLSNASSCAKPSDCASGYCSASHVCTNRP